MPGTIAAAGTHLGRRRVRCDKQPSRSPTRVGHATSRPSLPSPGRHQALSSSARPSAPGVGAHRGVERGCDHQLFV